MWTGARDTVLHIAHGLTNHSATCNAAKQAGSHIRHARASPVHSRFLLLGVPVRSSATAAVSTDSSSPTMAMAEPAGR